MTTLTIITLFQTAIFSAYVYYIYRRFGMLTSISASTYKLPGKQNLLFLATLGSIGVLNLFQEMSGWGVMSCGFLLFAGVTLRHASKGAHQNIVHAAGTVLPIVLTFIGLWVLHGMWLPSVLLPLAIAALYRTKFFIWWVEIVAMFIAMASYLIR